MNKTIHSDSGADPPPSELEQWVFDAIEDYNDGTIDDQRLAEFRALLKSRADVRQLLVDHHLMSHLISAERLGLGSLRKSDMSDSLLLSSLSNDSALNASKNTGRLSKLNIVSFAVLVAILLVGAMGIAFRFQQTAAETESLASIDLKTWSAVRPNSDDPPVAVLQNTVDAVWTSDELAGVTGIPLRSGWLELKSGTAAIRFNSGAVVTLVAASRLNLIDSQACFLESGDLVATVPEEAIGFQVDTSAMQLTDLGTDFAVSKGSDGETNVQVLKGVVSIMNAKQADATKSFRLNEGQACRIHNDGSETDEVVNSDLADKITVSRPAQRIGSYAFDSHKSQSGEWTTSPVPRVVGGDDIRFDDFVFQGVVPGPDEYLENLNRWSFKEWRSSYEVEQFYVGFKVASASGAALNLNRLSLQLLRSGGNDAPELAPQNGVVRVSSDGFETYRQFALLDKETFVLESKYISADLSDVSAAPEYEFRFLFKGASKNRAIRLDEVTLDVDVAEIKSSERFPFVIPGDDASKTVTDFSYLSPKPAGQDGFVRVRDGHFATDAGRLRLWGVNVGYGGCFPSHDDAKIVAAHLAKLGFNAIRIHHHESQQAPTGLLKADGSFDSEQVDRLDYFLNQLHQHGIYANLNLHVGREVSKELGIPQIGNSFDTVTDKYALHFQPEIKSAFREFCREFLTHKNPYRGESGLRRVDDPAIAMVEMCNENSFTRAGSSILQSAPEPYQSEIRQQWNRWLQQNYAGQTADEVWQPNSPQETSENLLASSLGWSEAGLGSWKINTNGNQQAVSSKVSIQDGSPVLRLLPSAGGKIDWHQQLVSNSFAMTDPSRNYTLRFDCRADQDRPLALSVSTTSDGRWESLGLLTSINLKPEWRSFEYRFRATHDVTSDANLSFSLGANGVPLEFRNLSLKTGIGDWSLPIGQTFAKGNVGLPDSSWAPVAKEAVLEFMFDTEHQFYRDLKSYLIEDVGVRVPLLTTQVDYQSPKISSEVSDYQDMHVYWHHPEFPGQDWDAKNWNVKNESMLQFPFENDWPRVSLMMRAGWRSHQQPFTISEWNASEPNFYSPDAVPMAAIVSSLQDWDGIFFFDYHNRRDGWNVDSIQHYFELNGQPCKLALLGIMGKLYRSAELQALQAEAAVSFGHHEQLGPLAFSHRIGFDPNLSTDTLDSSLVETIAATRELSKLCTPDQSVCWDFSDRRKPNLVVDTPSTKGVLGMVANRSFEIDDWKISFGDTERDYAIVAATSRDKLPISNSKSILLVAVGNAENKDMVWNADRTSVGKNWGAGPTMVNGINLELQIPDSQTSRKLFSLDGKGKRIREIPASTRTEGYLSFELGPQHKTIWYELTASKEDARVGEN